jgi:CheY-like chemotaxis protein
MDTQAPAQKKKVLLIDDDQFLVSLYKKNAEQYPIELTTAISGEEALVILRGGYVPDNILLDINMPGMSGVEVLKAVRDEKLAPNADMTILSNIHQAEHEEEFRKLGIQRFLPKSFLLPSQVLGYVVNGFGTDWAETNPA